VRPLVARVRRPPLSLREVPAARGYPGRVGRTLNALAFTRDDALVAALAADLDGLRRVAGVRRGTISLSDAGVRLRNVELVPGVRVTGSFPSRGSARLRITGPAAARGRITISRNGTATGRLGGRRIRARPRAAAASASESAARGPFGGPPQAARVVPFPAIR
jgi:hypothetical protein